MNIKNLTLKQKIILVLIVGLLCTVVDYVLSGSQGDMVYRDKRGNVLILRPAEGGSTEHVCLKANVRDGKETYEKTFEITVDPYSAETDAKSQKQDSSDESKEWTSEEVTAYELRSAVSEINDDISTRKVYLPSYLSSGAKIYWSTEKKTNTVPIISLMILTCFCLYRNRWTPLRKLQKARRESITKQLPEFVNKLVLLLNAGLVLSTAFERSVEEGLASHSGDKDYFYEKMRCIYTNMREMNSPLNTEFRAFAKESGDNGLMRISNILSDNISKGVALTEKLQLESEVLWINRKRDCEERGRLSETKLTLPLTIFLLVLIVITVSPALLEL